MAQERTGNGGKKRYRRKVRKAVAEDALRTTTKAAAVVVLSFALQAGEGKALSLPLSLLLKLP